MPVAKGTFVVTLVPRTVSAAEGADVVARLALDKSYTGDLTARGRGQMLASRTGTDGSAGYVAVEVVEGAMAGLEGSFVIQHFGIMNRGKPSLQVPIIPDSGTAGFAGIRGELTIDIDEDGTHAYTLTYDVPQ